MPKPEILDPQGQGRDGCARPASGRRRGRVRQGKHFELEVDDSVDDETWSDRRAAAGQPGDRDWTWPGQQPSPRRGPRDVRLSGRRRRQDRRHHVPRHARRRATPPARCGTRARTAVPLWHADARPARGRRRGRARRLLLRRLPARRGDREPGPGDERGRRGGARAACRCWASATASRSSAKRACCPARSCATRACASSAATSGSRVEADDGLDRRLDGPEILVPVKNAEGRYVADAATSGRAGRRRAGLFRYERRATRTAR